MSTHQIVIRIAGAGDDAFGAMTDLHADLYLREEGFNEAFIRHVDNGLRGLSDALRDDPGAGRLWVLEDDGEFRGGIGVTRYAPDRAQLRWFLIDPELRGRSMGRELVRRAVEYAREQGFGSMFLETLPELTTAAHLYREAGFARIREHPSRPWGLPGVMQIYARAL